jgi:hypothetical protein
MADEWKNERAEASMRESGEKIMKEARERELNKLTEDLENFEYLQNKMDEEGFDYCFRHYSKFSEIKDEKFHELRKEYLRVSQELEDYINNKVTELEEKINQ